MKLLQELLNIRYPIIQGGMANIATGAFAAACSEAGALGVIGSGGMNAERLEEEIAVLRSKTDRPFGVNLMLMNPDTEEMADLVAREHVPVVTTGAGNPGKYLDKWKEAGIRVIPVSASVALARRLERAGADMIIAEGTESGGHVGEMTTMTLLPQMVDSLRIPVIAAGGIADGRQLAAAFVLGACGAQIGTSLLVSAECPIHENYKEALIKAKDNSTMVTGRSVDAPVRIIKNQMAREYQKLEREGAERMELEKLTLGSLRRAVFEGDTLTGSLMAGQVCGQLKEVRPASEIIEKMCEDAEAICSRTAGFAAALAVN
ncbi:MAG: nitronate monooxygenase [Lachnospiraceae bacterium]|nr:nitronate monooxygenase [Lachnospiraceae bacterium]